MKHDFMLDEDLSKIKVKCECSHTVLFPSYGADIKVCDYCGKKLYRNEKVKFDYLLGKKLKEVN